MFRAAILPLFIAASAAAATAAHAGSPAFGTTDRLLAVARTEIVNNSGGTLSLCLHVRQARVLFLPVGRALRGYALAEDGCRAARFVPIAADRVGDARRAGLIAADLPPVPRLSLMQGIAGAWGWAVLAGLVAAGFSLRRQRKLARLDRMGEL